MTLTHTQPAPARAPDMMAAWREDPDIYVQTLTGRAVAIVHPRATSIDLRADVPDSLARIARWNGHVGSGVYSVAQHCCLGAQAFLTETGDDDLALAFLLHDAHEAYLGDITAPVARAVAWAVGDAVGDMRGLKALVEQRAMAGFARLKRDMDRAIYAAAGAPDLAPGFNAPVNARVADMDERMARLEAQLLMVPAARPAFEPADWRAPRVVARRMKPWPWPDAADAWRDMLRDLTSRRARAHKKSTLETTR